MNENPLQPRHNKWSWIRIAVTIFTVLVIVLIVIGMLAFAIFVMYMLYHDFAELR